MKVCEPDPKPFPNISEEAWREILEEDIYDEGV